MERERAVGGGITLPGVAVAAAFHRDRGTSLIRNCLLLGPYSRTMPRALRLSWVGGQFLMSEVPLYS